MSGIPTGTITFLFTDIEGSTKRWEKYPEAMKQALARHDQLLDAIIKAHAGYVFKTVGDAFCAAFPTPLDGVLATLAGQQALDAEDWGVTGPLRVRMALHTGTTEERDGDYFGPTVNRVARLLSAGHGGQILLSQTTAALIRGVLPSDCSLHDLGSHMLKDLIRAERIFQLDHPSLQQTFSTIKTLDNRPNNLPVQPTPFIGREQEARAAQQFLRLPDVRLLSFTGPGGTGKTRLSLQVAADLIEDFPDGVFFFPLAELADMDLVTNDIAQALNIKRNSDQPLLQTLKESLRDKQILLVLDNVEQILNAVPVVSQLLAAAPQLKLLITTRSPLRLYGEREFPVPPLKLPPLKFNRTVAEWSTYEAVQLFIARAQDVKPDFTLTAENAQAVGKICHRLDGLPLPIELAAARLKLFSPRAMLVRLTNSSSLLTGGARNLPARQQTLRGAIDWSYTLLSPAEQQLFMRLAVFQGGSTLEAIEAVCNADGSLSLDIVDGVESLISKSLLRQEEQADGEPRFVMLRTLRDYGLDRLEQTGDATWLKEQHTAYYLKLAQVAEANQTNGRQAQWLDQIEREHDNLRVALQWSIAQNAVEPSLQLGTVLAPFWEIRGHWREGRQLLDQVLAVSGVLDDVQGHVAGTGTAAPPVARLQARALKSAAQLALHQGDYAQAHTYYAISLSLSQSLGHVQDTATILNSLATVAQRQGDYAQARVLYEESQAIYRAHNNLPGMAGSLNNLANITYRQGDYVQARALYEESLAIRRQLRDRIGIAASLNNLANVNYRQGAYTQARQLFEECLLLKREFGDQVGIARAQHNLANVCVEQQDYEQAHTLYEESLVIKRELGDKLGIAYSLHGLGNVHFERGDHAKAHQLYIESLQMTQEFGDNADRGIALEDMARLASAQGLAERAMRLYGAADKLYQMMGITPSVLDQNRRERWLAEPRQTLGDAAAAAWDAGQHMTAEQAILYALSS